MERCARPDSGLCLLAGIQAAGKQDMVMRTRPVRCLCLIAGIQAAGKHSMEMRARPCQVPLFASWYRSRR